MSARQGRQAPTPEPPMEFRILGALEVRDRHGQPLQLGGGRIRALLAILLLHADQPVATDRLIDLLWDDEPPASARHSLHLLVHRLRRILAAHGESERLRTHDGAYRLEVRAGELDADRLEELLRTGQAELAGGRPAEAVQRYEAALALWHGPPLAQLGASTFASPAVARLEELHMAAATGHAEALLAVGRHADAVPALEELTRRHPTRERLCELLMLALYRSGRQADALDAYRATRSALVEGLGIEPGEGLQRLQRAVLNRDPSLAGAASGAAGVVTHAQGATEAPAGAVAPPEPAARRVVTVLVARLKVERSAWEDPEDRWARYGQTMRLMREEVERLGGVVHTEIGETLVATFGTRRTRGDDPARAVRAALALRQVVTAANATATVGIDTGPAIVDSGAGPADPPRVTGEVVHAATDLERRAPAGTILVGGVTRATAAGLTDPRVDYAPAEHLVTGAGEEIWEVVGAAPGADLSDEAVVVVNRERELALLQELLDRARSEMEPQLVTVVGTPGVGKTRLVAELRARDRQAPHRPGADAAPAVWCEGRSLPYGEGVTFWALAEIVKSRAGIAATDSAEEAVGRLGRSVTAVLGDAGETATAAEYLQRLVHPRAAADEDAGWLREAFTAWRHYLEALAADRPLVLVFEDLHWADDALLDFIEHLADHAHGVPLLIVCLAWPELLDRRPGWSGGKRNATTTALGPLSAAHTAALLDSLLGARSLPATRREELLTGSGGNPLFVEEYVRMLRERGEAGGAAPAGDLSGAIRPPATVELLIGARIDDLEPSDRALLADAAALGEVFWSGGLTAVSGREDADVTAGLHRLTRREFVRRVRQSRIPGQDEYQFRHQVIRDVAYGRLLRGDRAARHVAAARWLEGLGGGRAADQAELIAHHYVQGLVHARAAGQAPPGEPLDALAEGAGRALRQAGDRASALATHGRAIRYYDQALELWPPRHPERPELLLATEELRFELLYVAEEARLTEALEGLLAAGDRVGAARARIVLCLAAWGNGRCGEAAEHERRARGLLEGTPPSRDKARALTALAMAVCRLSRFAEALPVCREAIDLASRFGLRKRAALALTMQGWARTVTGDVAGVDDIRRAIGVLEELSSAALPRAYVTLCGALSHVGDPYGAFEASAALHEAVERFGATPTLRWERMVRLAALYVLGNWDEALAHADGLAAEAADAGTDYFVVWSRCIAGKIRLARGDLDGAAADSAAVSALARDGDGMYLLPAETLRASVLLATGPDAAARGQVERAAGLVRDLLPGHQITPYMGGEMGLLLAAHGQVPDLTEEQVRTSAWLRAFRAVLDGHPEAAADVWAEHGNFTDEAMYRMVAGERLAAEGRAAEAAEQLTRARAFYEEVRATRYLTRIDELLA